MIRIRHVDVAFAGGIACGMAALLMLGVFSLREEAVTGNDFSVIWAGPAAIALGANPYEPTTWPATLDRLGVGGASTRVYLYPVWVPVVLLPLGLLPLRTAAWLWAYGSLMVATAAMLPLARAELDRVPAAAFFIALSLFVSQAAILTVYSGQWTFWLVAAVAVVCLGLRRKWQARPAASLLALLAKPHLYALAFPALLRAGIVQREGRFTAIVGLGLVVAVAAALLLFPGWIDAYVAVVADPSRLSSQRATVLPFALAALFGDVGLIIGVVSLVAAVGFTLRFDPRSRAYAAAWLAVAPLLAPYQRSYDHLVLLVPVTVAIGTLARCRPALAYAVSAAVFLDLVVAAPLLRDTSALALGSEVLTAFVPIALSLMALAALWPDRAARPASAPAVTGS